MDITETLREGARDIEVNGTQAQAGPLPTELLSAADEIERLRKELADLKEGRTAIIPHSRDHAEKLLFMAETFWNGNQNVEGWRNRK